LVSGSAQPYRWSCNRRTRGGHRKGARILVLLVAWLALSLQGPALAVETGQSPQYLIGPGDNLEIVVWRQEELSAAVTVRPDGRISAPLIEDLLAAGKTPTELADEIETHLSAYLQDPTVTVIVASGLGDQSQQVRVIGKAADPTALAYRSGMTLLDAIIEAGGLSRQADGNGTVILRRTETGYQEIPVRLSDLVRDGDSRANVALQPGDVVVIPEGFLDGEWHVDYGLSVTETFSDNIDQDPNGERDAGFVSRAGPSISIFGSSARVSAAFNGNLSGVHQIGGDDEGFSLDPSIAGTSNTELVDQLLFFDLNASVSRQLLDNRQSTSASGASTSNRDLVAALTASPYLVHRLGDFANAEWRYRFSPVLVDSDSGGSSAAANDVYSHEGSFILQSGQDFTQFGWTWANRVGEEVRDQQSDIESASTDFSVTYPLWRRFSLIGAVGYEYRDGDEDEGDNFDGITWRGGFSWNPNPDLNLEATYGRRDDDESLDASLRYRLGPKTTLNASYSEALQTSQGRAISNLGQLSFDPETGQLIDERTGQPFTGDLDPFSFVDGTTRTRTLRLGAVHHRGRDIFSLSGSAGTSEGDTEEDEEFYGATLSWSRRLSSDLSLTSSAGYERNDFQDEDRTDDNYSFDLGLNYRLASDVSAIMRYDFDFQDSTDDDESYYENAVTIGLRISF